MKPDIIMNLTADYITTSSVLLNWTKPKGQSSRSRVAYENNNVTTENSFIEINDLTPGAQYTFRVFAVAADHVTEGKANQISLYTKPEMVRNLSVTEITISSVSLTWDEPVGKRDFFRIQWTEKRTHATAINTSYHINDLTAGVNYTFCITAVAGDKSTEGETFCISQYTKPNVIRNLKVTEITTKSVFLIWEEPVGNRSLFKIQWTGDKTTENSTSSNTSYHITNLTAGVNYSFNITAIAADKSTEGESVVTSNYTKPDVIINLTADDITASSILLNWTKPNGQSSRYRVEYENNNVTTKNTSIKIDHLTHGAHYTFRVFAVAADHVTEGRASQISLYTKPDVIKNLRVSEITTSSVFLTWDEPVGNRSFFKIQWTSDQINGFSATTNTSYNITSLTAGVNYTFTIIVLTADNIGESEPFCISKYTEPDVIRNLRVSEITTSSVFLIWEEPFGNRYFFKLNWTDEKTSNHVITNNTWYNITGLTAGVNYTFNIAAVAADKSTGASVVTSKYMKPDIIMNLTADYITTSSVLLNWTKPTGQSSRFHVAYENNNVTTENSFIEINYMIPGAQYTFRVFAVAADHVTAGKANQISLYTKPVMVRNLRVTEITISSVSLTWDEPVGKRDFFRIQWTEKMTHVTATNTSYHINDLTAGVNYTFCITAVAGDKSTEGETFCISQYTKSPESNTWLIVGVVLAAICFVFIIILILFFYSKRQTKDQYPDIPLHIFSNTAMRTDDYEDHFKQKHADGFAEEYEKLKTVGIAQSKNAALAIENKKKNRDSNVLPYDASRVKLSVCGSPFYDYINASYVPGYKSREEFIATQCPLPTTVDEFWRMIWEKNIYTIVMLNKCNEQG
uniref:Protein-tyrosine-phosphatase n=1 Tax=Cyprinus carpio carpio TaxID=630221 RepID=A0A9J8DBF3_CYPCA